MAKRRLLPTGSLPPVVIFYLRQILQKLPLTMLAGPSAAFVDRWGLEFHSIAPPSVFCLCLFAAKSLTVSIWSAAWARAPGGLKSCLVAAGSGSGMSPGTWGMPEGPLKVCGLQRLQVVPDHEPFQGILAQPSLGASEPTEVSQVVKHLDVSPPDLGNGSSGHHRDGGPVRGQPRSRRFERAWFRCLSRTTTAGFTEISDAIDYTQLIQPGQDGVVAQRQRSLQRLKRLLSGHLKKKSKQPFLMQIHICHVCIKLQNFRNKRTQKSPF